MIQIFLKNYMLQAALILGGAAILTLTALSFVTRYDNKYIAKAPLTQDQFVDIPGNGCYTLVDGWTIYPDALLSPADFAAQTDSGYATWAGEYPNLSPFHKDGDPYGIATWRLFLKGEGMVTLGIPELLCASRVYVNGEYLGGTGNVSPENYVPLIRDCFYSFPLGGEAELVIQTANYSHYYGGIWYVPVIGDADSIHHFATARVLLYGGLCAATVTLALFCMAYWKRRKSAADAVTFYFGMISLTFALRICYPFFRLFGLPSVRILYAVEDAAAMVGICFTLRIVFLLVLSERFKRLQFGLRIISLGVCVMSVILPLFVLPLFPVLVPLYGVFLSWYKIMVAGLLVGLTVYGCLMGIPHAGTILAAACANGICIFYGVLSIGRYEPLVGAYPEEYGAFCMVVAFAILMVKRSHAMAAENTRLQLHLQEEVIEKTQHLQELLMERGQLIAELGHDMKSPLTSLSNMAQIIRLNDIMLDQDTRRRMLQIEEQCGILSERLKSIQEIAGRSIISPQREDMLLNSFLSDFCRSCRPIIELNGTTFTEEITPYPCHVMANREQLFRALENLLYNAADFTPVEGEITISLHADEDFAYIVVSDTGCGISKEDLSHIFSRSFTTRGDRGGQGLGLAIARDIIMEHEGRIEVESEEGKGSTFTIRMPLCRESDTAAYSFSGSG